MENSRASILEDYYMRSLRLRLSGGLTRLSRTLAERARPTMERSDPSKYSAFEALVHRLEEYESIERQWGEGACLNFNHRATRELMSDTRADGTPVIHPRMIENGRRYQALVETVESSACASTASDKRAISGSRPPAVQQPEAEGFQFFRSIGDDAAHIEFIGQRKGIFQVS